MALRFVFFGTSRFSTYVLESLKDSNLVPTLIVTTPDRPQGRGLALTPSPVKLWAEAEGIDVLEPENIKDPHWLGELKNTEWDLFVVASYGKILPSKLLDVPRKGVLNVHPSLLPKYRGPSPLQAQILDNESQTGVTIMLLDEKMDHGPIVAQASITPEEWPLPYDLLEELLAREGGNLLAEVIPEWIQGVITPEPQAHEKATYTKLIKKEDGLIDLSEPGEKNYLKYLAYKTWPGTYFFMERNGKRIRVKITDASIADGQFSIHRVIPEGKKEMAYDALMR